jgi:D-glycero-D-manno-heptose 1,7-bisphosphate phosphatase
MTPALFVDRDGVLNRDVGLLADPGQLELLPGVPAALARVNAAGIPVVVVSNQSVVDRGLLGPRGLAPIHDELARLLAAGGAHVDAFFICPHRPAAGCSCRKPEPGLLLAAAREHRLDLAASVMIGDRPKDLEAARRAGCGRRFLVGAHDDDRPPDGAADLEAATLGEAVAAAMPFLTAAFLTGSSLTGSSLTGPFLTGTIAVLAGGAS